MALFLVCIIAGGGDVEPKKVADSENKTTTNVSDTDKQKEEKTVFYVGETAELKGVQVTMTNFEESTGQDFVTPTDGNVFALAEFEIVNNTDSEINISSMLSFEAYADDYSLNYSLSAAMLKDGQLDGTVAAGKIMKGWIGWEVPEDYQNVEIHFTDNVWSSSKFVFLYEK